MINRFFIGLIFITLAPNLLAQEQQQDVFNIYFKTNSDRVSSESMAHIRQRLIHIGAENIREIKLKGHADADANDSFNRNLSMRRVENSCRYFLTQHLPEKLIKLESLGESDPVSEVKSMNRRVEITIVYEYKPQRIAIGLKKYIIKGHVTNFNTGNPLASNYVLEDHKLNVFQSTKADGKFYLPTNNASAFSLTFSKDGFLNGSILVNQATFINQTKDTISIEVKLRPIEVIEKIVFEKIFFFSDSDSLKPESKPDLDKLMTILKADKNLFVEIQGHMNCPRSRPLSIYQMRYNHELSHKRAKTIYRYLIKRGIPADQLTFKGMSNANMIYPEPKNEQEADKNKRVEVWKLKIIEK